MVSDTEVSETIEHEQTTTGLNHRNHSRCLIINSDLGNIPENLSDIFDEVYSLELDKNRIFKQIHKIKSVPGRLERVALLKNNSSIIVCLLYTSPSPRDRG